MIKKSGGGMTIKEGEKLEEVRLKNIQYIINNYQNKINTLENEISTNSQKQLEDQIKSFNSQLDYNIYQEYELKRKMKFLSSTIDYDSLISNNFNQESSNQQNKSQESQNKDLNFNNIANNENQMNSNKEINLNDVLDKANSELQIQKYQVLNENLKIQNEIKQKEKEKKNITDCLYVFNKIKDQYLETIKANEDKERIKEAEFTIKKLNKEISNFDVNLLKNIDKINKENDSLLSNLNSALNNIKKLDDKIISMNIDKRNETSRRILNCYKNNSNLAKQNNILVQEIINFSNVLYEKCFDNIETNENNNRKIDNFMELKETIEDFKNNYSKKLREKVTPKEVDEYDSDEYI